MTTRPRPFAIASSALLVSAAVAGPLDKSCVPADVSWLVHFDLEAALRSSIAKDILKDREDLHLEAMTAFEQEFGIDMLTDFKDATVFGSEPDGGDAVAVVTTTAAVDGAIEKLRSKGEDFEVSTEGSYDVYSWTDDGRTQYGLVQKAGKDRRLVYLAKNKTQLIAAAEVGQGHGEHLRGHKGSALEADPGAGAILFIASDVMPGDHGHEEVSMVLGKAKAIRLEIGEEGDNSYAVGHLTMASTEDAATVVKILQGLQAIAQLVCQSNPDMAAVKDLLNSQTIEAKGETIIAEVRFPTARLLEAIKAAEAKDKNRDGDDEHDADADDKPDRDDKEESEHHHGHHDKGPL